MIYKKLIPIIICCFFLKNIQAQQWLDKAVKDGHVDSVWNGSGLPQGIHGEGVIIGFTDWGFDYTHPVFYDTSMTRYRVLRAWDQWRQKGPAPEGFSYGTEIVGEEALLQAGCDTSNVYSYNYHGNHVASIAAGAGAGTAYKGVAPEADLLFASFLVSEQAAIDAFQWMYNVAQEEGKRLVINMSWGLYYMGNLDGSGRLADVMQELSDKGVLFVTSGGNNGDVDFHLSRTFRKATDTLKTQITFDQQGETHTWGQAVSMTSSAGTEFRFSLLCMDRQFRELQQSDFFSTDTDRVIDTFCIVDDSLHHDTIRFNARIEKSNSYNGRPQVLLKIKTPPDGYTIGLCVTADSGTFHAWNLVELTNLVGNWGDAFSAAKSGWTAGDRNFGLGMPAAVPCALTIAAHESSYKIGGANRGGNIASFSSYGPGLNGEKKPEISAPGYQVVAGISSFTDRFSGSYTKKITFNDREYGFAPLSGTSMSSPFAAGVAALVLQANPRLSSAQVKQILIETATQDYDTRHDGEERFGYGKINAAAAVRKAFLSNGTSDMPAEGKTCRIYPNPCENEVFIYNPETSGNTWAELWDMNGRCLLRTRLKQSTECLDLSSLSAGLYVMKIRTATGVSMQKITLR